MTQETEFSTEFIDAHRVDGGIWLPQDEFDSLTEKANKQTITAIWLVGGENKVTIRIKIDGNWCDVLTEHMPLQGNDGNVWPISHIKDLS